MTVPPPSNPHSQGSRAPIFIENIGVAVAHNSAYRRTVDETAVRVKDVFYHYSETMFCTWKPEAKFLDAIWTKVLKVFLLAIHSHLYFEQKWFETGVKCKHCIRKLSV
jgi:hypothetical protein